MTSPTKEVHQFYDFYRPTDTPSYRFSKHIKPLGDSSHRADRDDSKMLADTSAGVSRLRPDIDSRKDKKDIFTNPKRLSFADTLSGNKRLDRLALERELDDATAQIDELRQKNRSLRHQLNLANQEREKQSIDREKALNKLEKLQRDQMRLVTEMDLIVKENNLLQKKLDQNDHQVDGDLANHLSDTVKQVQQLAKEKEDIQRRMLEEMENIKDNLDEAINDRDELKYQISELLREKEKLLDRISVLTPEFEATESELDKVQSRQENHSLQSRLPNQSSPEKDDVVELESLREKCADLEQERDELIIKIETMRSERQCSVTSTDDEGVGSMTEYRHDEDLRSKMSALEEEKCKLAESLESTTKELRNLQAELTSAKEQIKHIMREKGVALRESTATFEESVQLQSRIVELSAEKDCATEQRKIATKEKERVITENVSLKNKLESIMMQRQKDAKELGNMRRSKDQAYQEVNEMKKHYRELKEKTKQSEYELTLLAETICSQLNIEKKGSASSLLHRYIEQVQLEKDAFLSRLFNGQKYSNISLGDACARLDAILHEKNCLATELERNHGSERDKDKIAKLTDQVNSLMFERDALQEQLDKMSSKIARHNAELKRCGTQIQQLQKEKKELKTSHAEVVEQHAKTLERVDEMWKHRSRPQIRWDELWEEKHISLEMEAAGNAGFAIMGGRDQQQLPNPNAVIVTHISTDSPACRHLMPGDVVESVNGVNLSNVDHCDAVCAISENKGILNLVIRRCKNPVAFNHIQNGAAAIPSETNTEEYDYSLFIPKEGIGFKYQWTISYQVSDILSGGPAHQILQVGDKIIEINGTEVSHMKNSIFKKLLKPQKGVLKLRILRNVKEDKQDANPSDSTSRRHSNTAKSYSRSSSEFSNDIGPEAVVVDRGDHGAYRPASCGSYSSSSRNSSNYSFPKSHTMRGHSSANSDLDSPTRLKGRFYSPPNIHPERPSRDDHYVTKDYDHPTSQDSTETGYSTRPTKLVVSSQDSLCTTGSSQSSGSRVHFADIADTEPLKRGIACEYGSIDYDANNNSNKFAFSNSQTESVNLSFHSQSFIAHNHLTVETTQQTLTGSDDEEPYNLAPFARDDVHRTTVRTRSMTSLTDNRNSLLLSNGYQAESEHSSQASQPTYGGLIKLRSLSNSRSATMGKREHSASTSRIPGVRRNSHTGSTISTSTITSARSLSNLDDRNYNEYDPLCNATYLRANFAYVPRYRKELHVSIGDVFHIHDESPERHKASFWVSKLNDKGTDADIGAIPNSPRAKYYIEEQGEDIEDFYPVYTEVEPFQDRIPRPVLIFGVAAEALIEQLLEEHPETFVSPKTDNVASSSKVNRRVLDDDIASGKIISYTQRTDGSYDVLNLDMIKSASKKSKHCLLVGTISTHQALAQQLPPISIFIKAQAAESISTFDPTLEDPKKALEKYQELKQLEHEHGNKFSTTLCLVMLEVLVGQIHKEVMIEQKKMSWVPVQRDY